MAASRTSEKYDRGYMEWMADRYIEALVAHQPGLLPLSDKVKFTENGQVIKVGEALWGTASGGALYKLYACDPQTGQVALYAKMEENGRPILIALRLKIKNKLITEIETIVARSHSQPWKIETQKPRATFLETVPPSERLPRQELIRISDLYFEGLVRDDGNIVPFDDKCNRIENSMQTTNNPALHPAGSSNPPVLNARDQFNSKTFSYITSIPIRQYNVVDEERQITVGTFVFNHTGTIKSAAGVGSPFSALISELFRIKDKKIRDIEAIMMSLPYGAKSGWD
jgi:hypothetical protein